MFARFLEFTPKAEKRDELMRVIRQEILPVMKKQPGFLELLPFVPDAAKEKMVTISMWTERYAVERYVEEAFPRVEQILKPFLSGRVTVRMFKVETTVCQHFVEALTSAA
jgi:quinol monooxygenase YgiN